MTLSPVRSPVRHALGLLILVLSAMGYPLTRLVIGRLGRRGAVLVEGIAVILLVRDAALVAIGTPTVLRPVPARLLYLELAAAIAATLSGLRLVVGRGTADSVAPPADASELVRRTSIVALFAIHTVRFWVYLQPDHGLKEGTPDHAAVSRREAQKRGGHAM